MPTVPSYDNLRTSVAQGPNASFTGPSGPAPGSIAADQMQGAGRAMQGAGAQVAQIAEQMQQQVDQVRVNDAVNQARRAAQDLAYNPEKGYLSLKGDAALTRPDGVDMVQEYGDKLQEHLGTIAASLSTPRQRQQFEQNAAELATQFSGQLQTHMMGEFRNHALSVQDGTIDLASDDAKRQWNDPDAIGKGLGAAKAAVYEKGRISGWSAAQTEAAMLVTTSKVHTEVINAALENNNPTYAVGYLDKNRAAMTADDILRVQGHVTQQVWGAMSMQAVHGATVDVTPKIAPTGFDRMVNITAMSESGGKETNIDGSLVTSPKGAQGKMQVRPGTRLDPGFGVRPAQDDTPEERTRVGRDYLQAMLQRYGDPAKAWAAYNAGPGRLDAALAEAEKDAKSGAFRGGVPGDLWLQKMPKETQDYVAKNVAALGTAAGTPARPTELDFVNAAIAKLPAGSPPQVVQMTRTQAAAQFTMISKSLNEQGDNALAAAQRYIASNPGVTMAQLPAPLLEGIRQFAPDKLDDLVKYAKVINEEGATTDLTLYNRLTSHPQEMARMTDAQFESLRPHLATADFKHFAGERQRARSNTSDESVQSLNTSAVSSALTARLQGLGISPSPKASDTDGQARLGGIKQFVNDSLYDAQRALGRKLTPLEVDKHLDDLFSKSVQFKGVLFGSNTLNLMTMQKGDLPSGAYDQLKAALVAQGNRAPTDNDVINLYRKLHATAN